MLKFIFLEIRAKSYFEVLRKNGEIFSTKSEKIMSKFVTAWLLLSLSLSLSLSLLHYYTPKKSHPPRRGDVCQFACIV